MHDDLIGMHDDLTGDLGTREALLAFAYQEQPAHRGRIPMKQVWRGPGAGSRLEGLHRLGAFNPWGFVAGPRGVTVGAPKSK
jgi:hypothetical protein